MIVIAEQHAHVPLTVVVAHEDVSFQYARLVAACA